MLVAQERRRTAARAHRPHPEQSRKRARTTGIGGDENATSRVGKTLHADARVAAMEASHRIALKGLQRKVAELERRAIEREEAWENERMEAEARTHRVVVEAEERMRSGLEDERRAMRDTIRRAVERERKVAAEEATRAVKTSLRPSRRQRLRGCARRELEAVKMTADRRKEEALSKMLASRGTSSAKRIGRSRRCGGAGAGEGRGDQL